MNRSMMNDSSDFIGKRDSCSSVKSLKSYANFRESVGKCHAFIEKVTKIDAEIEIKNLGKKSKGSLEKVS